jgi:hypothetical protein
MTTTSNLLLDHIFPQDNIALSYKSNANVTAREAFHSATANCMSLIIMAYALAKQAGLAVDFQQVEIPEYRVKNGQCNLLTGHTNLLIKTKGGQALVDHQYIIAYQYLKAATQADKLFSSAWGNLAVLYKLTNNDHIN